MNKNLESYYNNEVINVCIEELNVKLKICEITELCRVQNFRT